MRTIYLALGLMWLSVASQAQTSDKVVSNKQHKMVLQLVSADSLTQRGVIKNIKSIKAAMPNAEIELVVHGMGVDLVKNGTSIVQADLTSLVEKGLKIVVCENTLRERKIEKTAILSIANYTPAGIPEIVLRQEEGWSYVRIGK